MNGNLFLQAEHFNAWKVTAGNSDAKFESPLHLHSSIELSICNFSLFGKAEQMNKERSFQRAQGHHRDLEKRNIRKHPVHLL
jgi:hypothetical protein